jgi:hypothetical protein
VIPKDLHHLFWEVDLADFDPADWTDYTIFRVLEYGDVQAVAWLRTTFPEDEIRRVLHTERRLSPKSASYWALIFGIPESHVASLCNASSL